MSDFTFLDHLDTKGKTATFRHPSLPGVKIDGYPANESNQAYEDATQHRLGAVLSKTKRRRSGGNMDADSARGLEEKNRTEDAKLFPRHIFNGWTIPQGIPFSVQAAEAFCFRLIEVAPDIFDDMRDFFADPMSFRDYQIPDAEDIAGNSGTPSSGG